MKPPESWSARTIGFCCAIALLVACKRDTVPSPIFVGSPDDIVHSVVTWQDIDPRSEDYSPLPDAPGIVASHGALLLEFADDVTVEAANELLIEAGAELAGAIPNHSPGHRSLLYIRVPTTSHEELEPLLETLAARPEVALVTRDMVSVLDAIPSSTDQTQPGWSWELSPRGGNWGFELMQVPQAWNLLPALAKRALAEQDSSSTKVGIIDGGFLDTHPDLRGVFAQVETRPELVGQVGDRAYLHGTRVAGIIAAHHDGVGVDGLDPSARLYALGVKGAYIPSYTSSDTEEYVRLFTAELYWRLDELVSSGVRLVNYSMGYSYKWEEPDFYLPQDHPKVLAIIAAQKEVLRTRLADIASDSSLAMPILVAAAGNESQNIPPELVSPICALALETPRPDLQCIEALELSGAGVVGLGAESNAPGTLSAPGYRILTTSHTNGGGYVEFHGTSAAVPHIVGALSFLFRVEPTLSNAEALAAVSAASLLTEHASHSPTFGLFDALMQVDASRGTDTVKRMLIDIDDGTPDGNLRVDGAGREVSGDDEDGDGGAGDGDIDMSDFRRLRDWWLETQADTLAASLDGREEHPKKDLNGDGWVKSPAEENIYPRGDFNGDGILSNDPTDVRLLPGFGEQPVSDLEVLQSLFDDPYYLPEDLPGLMSSGDVHFDPTACYELPGVQDVFVSVRDSSGIAVGGERSLPPTSPDEVVTVPSGMPAEIRVHALDADGTLVGGYGTFLQLAPGEDVHVVDCHQLGGVVFLSDEAGTLVDSPEPPFNGVVEDFDEIVSADSSRSAAVWASESGLCMELSATSFTSGKAYAAAYGVITADALTNGMPTSFTVHGTLDIAQTSMSVTDITVWFRTVRDYDTADGRVAVYDAFYEYTMSAGAEYTFDSFDGSAIDESGSFSSGAVHQLDLTGEEAVYVKVWAYARNGGDVWGLVDLGGCP